MIRSWVIHPTKGPQDSMDMFCNPIIVWESSHVVNNHIYIYIYVYVYIVYLYIIYIYININNEYHNFPGAV